MCRAAGNRRLRPNRRSMWPKRDIVDVAGLGAAEVALAPHPSHVSLTLDVRHPLPAFAGRGKRVPISGLPEIGFISQVGNSRLPCIARRPRVRGNAQESPIRFKQPSSSPREDFSPELVQRRSQTREARNAEDFPVLTVRCEKRKHQNCLPRGPVLFPASRARRFRPYTHACRVCPVCAS